MKFRNMLLKYHAPVEGDGDPSDSAPPADAPAAPSIEELQATIAKMQKDNESMANHQAVLLKEKKEEQAKRQAEEEARQRAELESQKKAGDLEAFEKSLTEQFSAKEAKRQAEIDRLNDMILGGRKSEIISDLAGSFVSPEVAKLMLGNLVTTEHGDGNTVSTSFKGLDGQLVTTDPKAFKEYLMGNELFAPYLKGVDSAGGLSSAAKPAASGGQAPVTDKDKRIAAINKRLQS